MSRARVLVVEGGWQRGVLSATRSLGRAGHAVGVASAHRGHAARSRHCAAWHPLPPVGSSGFLPAVGRVVEQGGYDVVFAGDDEHLLVLSEHRDSLGRAVFAHPPHASLLRAMDKLELSDLAVQAGLSVPETRAAAPPDGQGWIGKERLYRPGASHVPVTGGALRASTRELVYQRVVAGDLFALVTLTAPTGELCFVGAQTSEAVYPEPFGVSARARSVPVDPALVDRVQRLLQALDWQGLAELQFLAAPGHEPLLIDLNGRFFGSLALTAAAGVDLPSAWVELLAGGRPVLAAPRNGVGYQWLEGDLRRAWSHPQRGAQLWAALRSSPGRAHSIWSSRDPAPGARFALDLAGRAARRGRAS